MARKKKIRLAALNIKFSDQSRQRPEEYSNLWNFIAKRRIFGRTYSKQAILIPGFKNIFEDDPLRGIYGFMYKYYNLDPNTRWIDIATAEPIDDSIVTAIPHNIKPDYKDVVFVFYPQRHRLIFDYEIMTPSSAKFAFENLFAHKDVKNNFGQIEVFVISSSDEIERVIQLPNKTSINIRLTIPNPEDLSVEDTRVFQRLQGQNISSLSLVQKSRHPDGIELGDYEKSLMRLSCANGRTDVTVKESGESVTYSTKNSPQVIVGSYDPDQQTHIEAVREASGDELSKRN